ncbi:amidohydrolase family protein [Gracilimonas tropica]|uniref:amidohydrolase family protein n=1 Tax=Gracilimonas tropica TaxID=454600 RepID=UPI00036D7BD1|nr:amidohydrolase family protein [Gracilimonas tropica]
MQKLIRSSVLALVCVLFIGVNGFSQSKPQVFTGAQIIPISGEPINNGVLVVEDGKITAVGNENTRIPRNADVHDVSGKVIMPGLVDTHSHIGEGDGGDRSSAMHPDVRIMDAIDPRSDTFYKARAGGITSVNIMPGSGHLMSGQTVYLKLREANTIEDMLIYLDDEKTIYGGLKMANGTNPLGGSGFPGTRAKSAAMVRELFVKAQEYKAKIDAADGDESKMPSRDIGMETLVEVLEGKRTVHNHTHRHDDILTAIRLSEEFGYDLVLQHVSEAWRVADEIAEAGVPASIITLDSPGGKLEVMDFSNKNGAVLEKAGVLTGLHTDDGITDSRLFLRSAALAIREGMSREAALESVTIANAKMMDIADRTGTLDKGKDADFIILSGDPFSVYTHVEQTWVEGQKVFDRSNEDQKKYATGGYQVYRGEVHTHHEHGGQQ